MTTPSPALVADLASVAGRHPGARRRRQDGADAGAPGQARGAGQARDRRRALQRARRARGAGARRRRDDRVPTCSTAARSRRCRRPPTSSSWPASKFGATGNAPLTWAMNVQVPAMVAEVFTASRIVAFSTGCVYPFVPVDERRRHRGRARRCRRPATTPTPASAASACSSISRRTTARRAASFRLNYAIDMRYGVLHDIAPQGARRRADRPRHGPRQRDLAGRCQRGGAALPRPRHDSRRRRSTSPGPRPSRCAGSPSEFGRLLRPRRRRSPARRRRPAG